MTKVAAPFAVAEAIIAADSELRRCQETGEDDSKAWFARDVAITWDATHLIVNGYVPDSLATAAVLLGLARVVIARMELLQAVDASRAGKISAIDTMQSAFENLYALVPTRATALSSGVGADVQSGCALCSPNIPSRL
jgi:hypothetical protein